MMDLADKYAMAILNVYSTQLTFSDVEQIKKAAQFLKVHHHDLFFLSVPLIKRDAKEKWLKLFCRRFSLGELIYKSIQLLLDHKRMYLLVSILNAIVYRYEKQHHIQNIMVKSSIALPETYRQAIAQFINRQSSDINRYQFIVDRSLIAGVRIQSDTLLWEYSINKMLHTLGRANH